MSEGLRTERQQRTLFVTVSVGVKTGPLSPDGQCNEPPSLVHNNTYDQEVMENGFIQGH